MHPSRFSHYVLIMGKSYGGISAQYICSLACYDPPNTTNLLPVFFKRHQTSFHLSPPMFFLCFYFLTCFVPLFSVNVRLTVYFPPPSHVGALFPVSLRRAFPTAQWSPGGSRPSSHTLTGTASCDRARPTDRAIDVDATQMKNDCDDLK